jgi:hypothetical protein
VGEGGRIDIVLSIIRLALFSDDLSLLTTNIARAKGMVEKGGDWERRNLLNVYEATFFIITRRVCIIITASFVQCHMLEVLTGLSIMDG